MVHFLLSLKPYFLSEKILTSFTFNYTEIKLFLIDSTAQGKMETMRAKHMQSTVVAVRCKNTFLHQMHFCNTIVWCNKRTKNRLFLKKLVVNFVKQNQKFINKNCLLSFDEVKT